MPPGPEERPNTIPWPPLIYGAATAIALGLHVLAPIAWPAGLMGTLLLVPGLALMVAGLALDLWAMRVFRQHQTTVLPNRAATALITDGPFRFSRNPIYTGNTMFVAGLGLVFGVAWLLLAAAVSALLTQKLAIEREERHLAARFGNGWSDYAARTPRWLFWR